MPFSRPAPLKSYAISQVNLMLGRIYSIVLIAITVEAIVNGFGQLSFLNPTVFFVSATLFVAAVTGVLVSAWFIPSRTNIWLRTVAIVALGLIITWPLHFDSTQATPDGFQPWIWWPLGISAVAAGTTFRFGIGIIYLMVVSISWPILKVSGYGGSGQLLLSLQEALHLFSFSVVLVTLVMALRWEAGKTDSANQEAINSAVESARVDATEIERSRLDALVHDSVLTTLLVAANAESDYQRDLAAKSAADAISRLRSTRSEELASTQLTLASFFHALELRIHQASPDFKVSLSRMSDLPISSQIAVALTEATLQAVDNSVKHAGQASERVVRLRGERSGLKIVISDNGRGFRASQVNKDRIGISSSIITRVTSVDGRVFINSSPGSGTNVVIEWGQHD